MPDGHKHDHHEHGHDHHHHGHDHEHTHGHSHEHEHTHKHEHAHEHTHEHEHTHDHGGARTGSGAGGGIDAKTVALLDYMLNHNRDHAGELAAIAGELERAGMDAAARLVEEGVRGFQAGNEKLAEALASIRGGK